MKNGEAYLRVGDATRKLNAETLAALEYSKGIKSYESRLIDDATLDDLDADLIRQYTERLNVSASSALDVLKGRGLIREKDYIMNPKLSGYRSIHLLSLFFKFL